MKKFVESVQVAGLLFLLGIILQIIAAYMFPYGATVLPKVILGCYILAALALIISGTFYKNGSTNE